MRLQAMSRIPKDSVAKLTREEAKQYFDGWAADLRARMLLIDLVEMIYVGPGHPNNGAVASLLHAADYLVDRIAYEMEPHPKGMIRFPEARA